MSGVERVWTELKGNCPHRRVIWLRILKPEQGEEDDFAQGSLSLSVRI
jgi:hypothetical protein